MILTVYRPPSPNLDNVFFTEFSSLLQNLVTSSYELIITGDFNFHVNNSNCPSANSFLSLIDTVDLTQLVSFPTHTAGNTLDLLITHSFSNFFSDIQSNDPILQITLLFFLCSIFLPLLDLLASLNKFVILKELIPLFFLKIFSIHVSFQPLLQPFLLSLYSYPPHSPHSLTNMPLLKPFPVLHGNINHSLLMKSLLKSPSAQNLKLFFAKINILLIANLSNFRVQKNRAKKVAKLISLERRSYFRNLISSYSMQPKKL